ncbi:hypothetical protein H0H92_011053 [Tricholoma furcatifolium]|nr:hypothetical protein H0H92_011053 [Tricholoma furcatifolium]
MNPDQSDHTENNILTGKDLEAHNKAVAAQHAMTAEELEEWKREIAVFNSRPKAEEIKFVDENGPYDYDDGWPSAIEYMSSYERKMEKYERDARRQREAEMEREAYEREMARAQGEISDGENECYNEAEHREYEEEDFSQYPVQGNSDRNLR